MDFLGNYVMEILTKNYKVCTNLMIQLGGPCSLTDLIVLCNAAQIRQYYDEILSFDCVMKFAVRLYVFCTITAYLGDIVL